MSNSFPGTLRCSLIIQECFEIEYYMLTAEGLVENVYVRDTFTGMLHHRHSILGYVV